MTARAAPAPPCAKRKLSLANGSITTGLVVKNEEAPNPFCKVGGSAEPDFNSVILRETLSTMWIPADEQDGSNRRTQAAFTALAAFKPVDEIEGMIAAQATAMHFAAMECFRRAMIRDQPSDIASKFRKDGANLARGMTDMVDALNRKRGKGHQVVRVERVVVHEGGQAIVGSVRPASKVG